MKQNIQLVLEICQENRYMLLMIGLLVCVCVANFMQQGVVVNDEIDRVFLRKLGVMELFRDSCDVEIFSGRAGRFLFVPILHTFTAISRDYYVSRMVQLSLLFMNIVLYGAFLKELFKNVRFAIMTAVLMLAFLPVVFEYVAPQAYVVHNAVTMSFFCVSLILFIRGIERHDKRVKYLAGLFYFFSISCFEYMVVFVLFYPLLFCYLQKGASFREALKESWEFFLITIMYIMLYFALRLIFPSAYTGTTIQLTSISSMAKSIWTVVKASIPGYYMFNQRYQMLFQLYTQNVFSDLHVGRELFHWFVTTFISLKVLCSVISVCVTVCWATKQQNTIDKLFFKPWVVLIAGVYVFLPPVPNALTSAYQEWVSIYRGIPVDYVLYFITAFIFSTILWNTIQWLRYSYLKYGIILLVGIYCAGIQCMNATFAGVQNEAYHHLLAVEDLFDTDAIHSMPAGDVFAPDLFRNLNPLTFDPNLRGDHWTNYAVKYKHLPMQLFSNGERKDVEISGYEHNIFLLISGNGKFLLSKSAIQDMATVHDYGNKLYYAKQNEGHVDHKFYCYPLHSL